MDYISIIWHHKFSKNVDYRPQSWVLQRSSGLSFHKLGHEVQCLRFFFSLSVRERVRSTPCVIAVSGLMSLWWNGWDTPADGSHTSASDQTRITSTNWTDGWEGACAPSYLNNGGNRNIQRNLRRIWSVGKEGMLLSSVMSVSYRSHRWRASKSPIIHRILNNLNLQAETGMYYMTDDRLKVQARFPKSPLRDRTVGSVGGRQTSFLDFMQWGLTPTRLDHLIHWLLWPWPDSDSYQSWSKNQK